MKINLRFSIFILAVVASFAGAFYYAEQQKDFAANTETSDTEVFPINDDSRDHEGDTFSIVAYDKTTGQVGGAGCSCVNFTGGIDFLSDLITDGTTNSDNIVGAIHTQAAYDATNQNNARTRMLAGDTPSQIITWLDNNDSGGNSSTRQYGVVGVDNPGVAGFTGSNNGNYANHISINNSEFTVSIQGNILDVPNGQDLLDDMSAAFLDAQGNLGDRLMAAMQAAKRVGGDNRCQSRGNSGRTAFIKLLNPGDAAPTTLYTTGNAVADQIEPIDVLQCQYDSGEGLPSCRETITSFPYTMDFETRTWVREDNCGVNSSWIRSRFSSPSGNTGPSAANQGTLYSFVEASDIGGQGTAPRNIYMSSPCFDFPSNHIITMTFDYHMYGAAMGTLTFEVSDNGGASWTPVWSLSGNQGNSWFNDESVDLSSYSGSTIKIRVNALTGNGFESDFALDDIQITAVPDISIACTGITYTWNGSSWSPAGTPGSTDIVVIDGNYDTSVDGDLTACSLTVNAGNTLTVGSNGLLDVDNDITVDGSLIIDHTGILVQTDPDATITNNGTINVNVTTPVLQTRDFVVLGSPLSGETRSGVYNSAFLVLQSNASNFIPHPSVPSGGTNFADDNGDFWNQLASGPINTGEGYIVRPQDSYTDPANEAYDFTYSQGVFNNGFVDRSIVYNGAGTNPNGTPNILANPYASPVSADALISGNALVNEVYFWEHLTPPSSSIPGAGSINFSMDDISIYNLSGGTAAANDPGTTTEPNGVISTAQGFGIKATASGTVTFDNTMRLSSGNNTLRNNQSVDRLWLNVTNTDYEIGSNALIAFNQVATDGIDTGYDSERLSTSVGLYSHLDDGSEELAIQTRGAFDETVKIPVGFSTQVAAEVNYTISVSKLEGNNLENIPIYLIDNQEQTITDLSNSDYSFKSNKGSFNGRFTIQFEYEVLATQDFALDAITVFPNPVEDILSISSPNTDVTSLTLYNIQGRKILERSSVDDRSVQLDLSTLNSSIYLLKVTTDDGTLTKRIIKR